MKVTPLRPDSSPHQYPSLFGRYTAIFSGHDELQKTMSKVREMGQIVARCDEFPAELRPSTLLQELFKELQEHFELEESEQYFGTIEAAAPKLKEAVVELRAEHTAILRAAKNLLDLSTHEGRERGLAGAAEGLLDWLKRHETRETAAMREFLSRDAPGNRDDREAVSQDNHHVPLDG